MCKLNKKTILIQESFADDFITRKAGERLRNFILEARKKDQQIEIDFSDTTIASTSFFDEGFAKLMDENWSQQQFESFIILRNINPFDLQLLETVCGYRDLKVSWEVRS